MAGKHGLSATSFQQRVSEDWVVGTTGIEPVTPTMSTQCVDGNYNEISENRASNVRFRSRLGHGNLGHFLGQEAHKLRRLLFFRHSIACTIASFAYAVAR
jgi:hypothetical protein